METSTSTISSPETWEEWLASRFNRLFCDREGVRIPFAPFHIRMWDWASQIEVGTRPDPLIEVLPRGGGKSTNAELMVVYLGDKKVRRYCLYVSGTQEQADDHVMNIANLLESPDVAIYSPKLAARRVGKYGNSRGWRRNRLITEAGLVVDAIGLDTAARGRKLDQFRPDFMVFDDLDEEHDTELKITKKIDSITRKLIPAGSPDLAVLAVQNLVHAHSIFTRLVDGRADFLSNRVVDGPHKALNNFKHKLVDGRVKIISGTPTWEGLSIEICQGMIDDMGLAAFLSECQHEASPSEGTIIGDLWQPGVHIVPAFGIPRGWRIFRAFDWGYSRPFSVGWWARSDGTTAPDGRTYARGTLFRIHEWYGWNGKPNQGVRMDDTEIAEMILTIEGRIGLKGRVWPGPADSGIWDGDPKKSTATLMAMAKVHWHVANKHPGSRISGLRAMRTRLKASLSIPMEAPGLFIFEGCKQWTRTVVHLPKDPTDPDDAWTEGEDHAYDESRYAILFSTAVRKGPSVTVGMY
ncbi:MAG: hypothetical protein V3W44_10080 [Dehalococcoidales bacterium]